MRVDTLDSALLGASCTGATPACVLGTGKPLVGQSTDAFALPQGSPLALLDAKLVLALGAPATGVTFFAAANSSDPADFGPVPAGSKTVTFVSSGSPLSGNRFRWKASFTPPPSAPISVQGLQWLIRGK